MSTETEPERKREGLRQRGGERAETGTETKTGKDQEIQKRRDQGRDTYKDMERKRDNRYGAERYTNRA
jgi:hypothetical protein